MKDHLEYRGYHGSAEVDIEAGVLVGRLLFLRDSIAYSAPSPRALEKAFRAAVDDYLSTCAELGDEPDLPCKGSFNVRVSPELHRDLALFARRQGMGLNDVVREAITRFVRTGPHVSPALPKASGERNEARATASIRADAKDARSEPVRARGTRSRTANAPLATQGGGR